MTLTSYLGSFSHMRSLSSRSRSTLCNHKSTYLHLPLLFLLVNARLMALLLPQTFSPAVGKSKYSYTLPGISYVYDLGNAATVGVTNRILRDTGTIPVKRRTIRITTHVQRALVVAV
jgi:hypothetical protein